MQPEVSLEKNRAEPASKSQPAPADTKTILLRLMRFLAAGEAVRGEGKGGTLLLQRRGDGGRVTIAETCLTAALRQGLVVSGPAGGIALTEPGRQWLKRALIDGDGAFQDQHRILSRQTRDIGGEQEAVVVNEAESPLAMLRRLKGRDGTPFLSDGAFRAGERLRSDFDRGQLQPRVSANWEASVARSGRGAGNGIADLTDAALAARQRVDRALIAVGPELSGVLVDVCCFLKGVEAVERERQWPVRSGKLMLKTALLTLQRHYEGG